MEVIGQIWIVIVFENERDQDPKFCITLNLTAPHHIHGNRNWGLPCRES